MPLPSAPINGQRDENGKLLGPSNANGSVHGHETIEWGMKEDAAHLEGPVLSCKTPRPKPKLRKQRKAEESLMEALCTWTMEHQIGIALNLVLLLALTHLSFPRARPYTRKFYELSYRNPATGRYAKGWDDGAFVAFWLVVFMGLRVALMDYCFTPLAEACGADRRKQKVRFAEQAWTFVYSSASFGMGMYIFARSSYWLQLRELWTGWPDREMDGLFKWYYLVQYAFWLAQIVVVNMEERRKDHWQMFSHHLVTCCLIFGSYGYHYVKVGNVILCIMDSVDISLALAKMLNYLNLRRACDITFGVFMLTWFAARHACYLAVVYSIYRDYLAVTTFGCFAGTAGVDLHGPTPVPAGLTYLLYPFLDPRGLACQSRATTALFVALLLALQAILVVWFGMILGVAYRVLSGKGSEDPRSDDEEEEDEEEPAEPDDEEKQDLIGGTPDGHPGPGPDPRPAAKPGFIEVPAPLVEEEVGAEDLHYGGKRSRGGPSRRYRKGGAASSGVALAHDHKELLGRIGCDKQSS